MHLTCNVYTRRSVSSLLYGHRERHAQGDRKSPQLCVTVPHTAVTHTVCTNSAVMKYDVQYNIAAMQCTKMHNPKYDATNILLTIRVCCPKFEVYNITVKIL